MFGLLNLLLSAVMWSQQAAAPVVTGVEGARLVDVHVMEGTLYHVQGIALDREHIWVTSVDAGKRRGYVHQFNRATYRFERQVDVTDGALFHPGGLSVSGDSIWVPVAEYRPDSSAVLLELDKRTLTVKRRIRVADHLGCVAVTPDGLIAGNWSSRRFYVFDREGKQVRVIENASPNQYQDIKFVDGMLVGSGNLTKTTGAIDWYAWPSMELVRSLQSGVTDKGRLYTAEAMALEGRDLYLLPEDGPSRLFHFVLEEGTR
jgi:hypothetical protein